VKITHRKIAVAIAAVIAGAVMALSQTAYAYTFHTMRPAGNTAYCVADLSGNGGNASLINPCTDGDVEAWAVEPTTYDGGFGWNKIVNQNTGLCLETNGYEKILAVATCNGDEAQAWGYNSEGAGEYWYSPYIIDGNDLCIDASATQGVRAWPCNNGSAQIWLGPQ
jgi:Ricin-type beta-trefoil lectin domain